MKYSLKRLILVGSVVIATGACAKAQSFTLDFPIAGQNPYTVGIFTVLDHSTDYFYDASHHSVVAYTGEMGKVGCGPSGSPCGFYNGVYPTLVPFIANGNYHGASKDGPAATYVLSYRGHSGYDYDEGQGTTVVAPADGDLYVPASDSVNNFGGTADPYCDFHTFYIYHGNGWTTWYLHTNTISVGTFNASPHAQQCSGIYNAPNMLVPAGHYGTSDIFVAHVTKGQAIATVGDWAYGWAGGVGFHLHFEVRRGCEISTGIAKGCMVVDPYGWEWDNWDTIGQTQCYKSYTNCATEQSTPLWNLSDFGVQQPVVSNVSLAGSPGNYTATITGNNFAIKNSTYGQAEISLWDQNNQYWISTLSPSSITNLTSNQIVVQLSISTPTGYALKVRNPSGPRSIAKSLGTVSTTSSPSAVPSVPLVLDGQPAPGGGTVVSFEGFESYNNRSEAIVSVGVDTNGDGKADYTSDLQYSGGSLAQLTVPGFTKISDSATHVLRNNNGDIAFADDSNGQPPVNAIWVLPSGASSATEIIGEAWACPSSCPLAGSQVVNRIFGPLAFDDLGDVAFEASLYNSQTNTTTCCFLFVYYASDGSIVKAASDLDTSPIGGKFDFVEGYPVTALTSDGDAIFDSQLSGGNSSGGIFRYSRTQGLSKLIAQGDEAPSFIGGTLGYPEFGRTGGVSGRQLVFTAPVSSGKANQFIGMIKDITVASPSPTIIAYQGEPTQTVAGGDFSYQYNSSILPFGHYGIEMPCIRSDGQVVFYSYLAGSVASTGASSLEGIFIWNGTGFQKIVADGDQVSGQVVSGVSSTAINDHGEVLYFAAKLQ